jgi:glycerol-3-phosphate dehydrogenase (NAD(P)+)
MEASRKSTSAAHGDECGVRKIAILGAGSCGTALAVALARSRQPHKLSLWVHGSDVLGTLRATRENSVYLPGIRIREQVQVTGEMGEALAEAEIVLGVMPAAHARAIYTAALPFIDPQAASRIIFVSATKGLEEDSFERMTEVIADVTRPLFVPRVAVLSGPSFALEIARGDPTAVVIASGDPAVAAAVQEEFSGPTLRFYTNNDTIGVEMGGAVKNVIAIAAGVCVGLGLGANTIAALITRGLAEMTRLAVAMGGRRDTLAGLAGLGDLVLTATGALSRNRSLGVELGKGRPLADVLAGTRMVAEGVGTTAATLALARKNGIEMPITEQMDAVLHRGRAPGDAIRELMDRRLKQE